MEPSASVIAVGRPVAQTAPAQIPACPIGAPGSSEVVVSVSGVTKEKEPSLQSRAWPNGDPWAWHVEVFEQIIEALPRETAAFSEAAVGFLRNNPQGQAYVAKLEKKHGKAKALTALAHKLARAVYHMLRRKEAFDLKRFINR